MDDVAQAVISATATVAGVDKDGITPGQPLQDLGIDSIEFVSLIYEVEESLDITLPDAETARAVTIGDLMEISRRALSRRAGQPR